MLDGLMYSLVVILYSFVAHTSPCLGLILVVSIHLPLQARGVVALLLGLTGWSALTVRLIRALRRRDQSGLLPHVDL